MKKAVLLDIDGTVLDAREFVFSSVYNTVKVHNLPKITDRQIKKVMGKPIYKFYAALFPGIDSLVLGQTHMDFQKDNFHLIKPFAKTKLTLKNLKEKGFLIAAVSNRLHESLVKSLKLAEIDEYFDVIVCADDVKNPKPHEEHLLTALNFLKVEPENAYMVGDTVHDILAGKNAKVKTVGAIYGWTGKDIAKSKPDYLIESFGQLIAVLE